MHGAESQAVGAVFITRPQPQADQWRQALAQRLSARVALHVLPMIAIAGADTPALRQRLQQAWQDLPRYAAVFFISVPAVQHFFAAVPDALPRWHAAGVRAWAPGCGTRQALCDAGVPAERIDSPPPEAAQFDSETLWPLVAAQMPVALAQDRKLLRVRGADQPFGTNAEAVSEQGAGRDWLAAQVQASGVAVDTVVAYQRQPPQWNAAQQAQVQQWLAQPHQLWVWSSSQALRHARQVLPQHHWGAATAIVTHPRIGEAASGLGFGRILSTRPALEDVAQSIQSWL